ncbi:hypothetical protein SAY87_023998 [Trapa incisa]|uniref:Uncharacterized protein n=1 Tax=Trapa incisa TaxID=236973 RepID=A0AAN7KYR0_9MYRT|nr:hypothetical protein SAY87_023998 [Trapa incisa]
MGYDPMTHRPRTDIFSSLPQLLALANLKELMDQPHHSLEEHAIMRLQAEAMATKLQFLQYLFQSPQPPAATSIANPNPNTSSNSLIDMDSLKLLSSLLQVLDPASGCVPPLPPAAVLGPLAFSSLHENNLSFPRLPELQNLGRFQTTPAKVDDHIVQAQVRERSMPFEQSENSSNPPWQTPMLTSRSSSEIVANDPIPDSIVNVTRDHACSSSLSYDAPIWPDLLLDDLPFSSSP